MLDKEDIESYISYLKLKGMSNKKIEWKLYLYQLNDMSWEKLIPIIPISLCIKENEYISIDHAWIEGYTCAPIFKRLTTYERLYLYHLYNGEDLPNILDVNKKTCKRILTKIKKKLYEDI